MEKNNLKRISCKRCQQRKIRCSRTFPCANCAAASAKCEFRESDYKRPPVSREYVAALEARVASLEGFLGRLKDAPGDERNHILDEVEIRDYVPSFSSLPLEDESALSEALTKASLQETTEGSMIYHGPTSIFQHDIGEGASTISSATSKPSPFHNDPSNLTSQTMRLCIGLFFFWQYPLFMFIDREAFINEFEENPVDGHFCSPPLIYAGAALGAILSPDPEIRAQAAAFADTAESILLTEVLGAPRPTSVQALLCLAHWEIGKANISKGWMFAGMALRMGQDIGFQRDPTHWDSEVKPKPTGPYPFDNEFRRRIYWGCFLSDKIFSLMLGRPTSMYEYDADVNLSEPLPLDPPIWENWLVSHDLGFLKTMRPAGPKLTLLFNQQIELARIIHDMLSQTFRPRKKKDAHARRWTEVSLNKLNARLVAWHEALPADMRWKKWWSNKDVLQPSVSILHTLYHVTRICLNLPFIASVANMPPVSDEDDEPGDAANPLAASFRVCKASAQGIVDVLERFRGQHTLGNAPLLFVGGAIIAMNAVLVTSRLQQRGGGGGGPPVPVKDTLLRILDDALLEMSPSWGLAADARVKFRIALSARQQQQQQQQQQQRNPSAAPEAEHPEPEGPVGVPVFEGGSAPAPGLTPTQGHPAVEVTPETASLGAVGDGNDLESPGQHVWEPMSVLGGEAAFWANMGDNFLAGSDLGFFDGVTGFDWPDDPPIS